MNEEQKARCVLTGRGFPETTAREDMTWCGKVAFSQTNWVFNNASHLALTGFNGMSGITACPDCVKKIKEVLDNCL